MYVCMYVCRFRQPAGSICIPPRWAAPPGKGPLAARRLYARAMTVTGRTSRPYASKPPLGSVPAGGESRTGSLSWTRGGAGRASQLADSRAGQSARMVPGQSTPKRKVLLNAGAFPGASRVPGVCVVQVWVPACRRRRALFPVGRHPACRRALFPVGCHPACERWVFGMRCVHGGVCPFGCGGGW